MSLGQLRLLKMLIAAGDRTASLPIPEMRVNLETFISKFPPVDGLEVEPLGVSNDQPTVQDRPIGEWVDARPLEKHGNGPVILYLHGGGFVVGSPRSHRQLAARLSRAADARCLSLDYRLAPEHPFPAALDDVVAAYRWLLDRSKSPERIAVVGDSAGAGLGVLALSRARQHGWPMPSSIVCLSPWVDLEGSPSLDQHGGTVDPVVQRPGLEKMVRLYLGDLDPRDPRVTPLAADLSGLPPMLIQAGKSESLVDDARQLAAWAQAAGVDVEIDLWPDMIHVWHLFAGRLEEGQQAIDQAGEFLRRHRPNACC